LKDFTTRLPCRRGKKMNNHRSLLDSLSKSIEKFLFSKIKVGTAQLRLCPAKLMTLVLAVIAVIAVPYLSFAQVRFGTIVGTVTDSTGATVSGATVKLTNLGTNETRTMQTSSGGIYAFPNLVAGLYRVDVETSGFKHFTQEKVEVQVDVTTRVDAALQVGNVSETVVVSTEAPPLQTDNASLGTVITQTAVESIPLSGRNVNNMLTLVPGVVAQGGTYGNAVSNQANGARTNAIGFGNYAIGGGFGNQSSFYVDGVPSNAPAGNINALIPSQDAVQEFRVVTNNVAAEYGNYAGGIVNLTTKSGTNAFHGSAYEYLRNKVLNANDYFSIRNGFDRPHLAQNQFGGTIGGPVIKDRTFFFFAFEREALKTATLVTNTVPTAAERSGDFSAAGLPTIYDPEAPGTQFQCNGVPNVICPDRLDSSAQALFATSYPSPNRPGLQNNFVTQMSTGGINQQFNARVDHRLSSKDNLFARYAYWKADSDAYDAWGTHTSGQGHTGLYTHSAILGDTHTINSSTILDLRLSYLRVFQHEFPDSQNVDLSQFGAGWGGLTSQLLAPANYPALSFSDGQGITGSNGIGSQLFWRQNVLTLSGNVTKLAGRHQIKFGGVMRHVQWISAPQNGVLTLNFDQAATANAGTGGSAMASALLGVVGAQGAQVASGMVGGSRAYFTPYGFYVDDTFQATRKLTLTAGLRWDQPSVFSEASNNDTVFLPKEASPLGSFFNSVTGQTQQLVGNVALVNSPDWNSQREDNLHWKLFSPRLGLAYRLTDKTVLRVAYGISYPPSTLSQDGPNLSPVNAAQGGGGPAATVANPFPNGLPQPKRRDATSDNFYGLPIFAMRVPGDPMPYVQQWNGAVERQIGKDASLTVAYAGSKGTHLLLQGWATVSNINLNQLPEQYFSMGAAALTAQVANPFSASCIVGCSATPITTPGALSGPTVNAGQLLLPFPQYGRVLFLDPHKGSSKYNSLQTSFMKRFGGKGILSVAYTYSKLMSDTDSSSAFLDEGFIFGGSTQDNNHLNREYSVSSYDVPHNLSVGYGVDLPFGRSKRFMNDAHGALNAVIGGWRVNGITTLRNGVPISAYQFFPGSALSLLGGGQGYFGAQGLWMRTDFDPSCDLSVSGSRQERAINGWFNTSCFTAVNAGSAANPTGDVRFGNEPRNVDGVRMDHLHNWDFSISKRNDITERVYVQFTAEFFNAFNHVRFGAPDTNISDGPGRFGKVTSQANPPRAIQFGLRLGF
jgi:outer membrane receptor protein involved in Fe transport